MLFRTVSSWARKNASFDSVIWSTVALGGILVIWDADQEGNQSLIGQVRATKHRRNNNDPYGLDKNGGDQASSLSSPPPLITFLPTQLRQLENDGYLIIDDFLTPKQVEDARKALPNGVFKNNPNDEQLDVDEDDGRVRTDKVYFFEHDDDQPALQEIRAALLGVANALAVSSFAGFEAPCHHENHDPEENKNSLSNDESANKYDEGWLGIPQTMQISLYERNQTESTGGDYYRAHTDACNDSIWTMGLVGYLRSKYLRRRYITCIVYLNDDWKPDDGGCLRLYVDRDLQNVVENDDDDEHNNSDYIDVEPIAGRLAIFSSAHIMHAVRPTFSRRLACSMWITLNDKDDKSSSK